jgi:hypothetical protein
VPTFCLAKEPECESLLGCLDAKQLGFCDGLGHQLRLIEWYELHLGYFG